MTGDIIKLTKHAMCLKKICYMLLVSIVHMVLVRCKSISRVLYVAYRHQHVLPILLKVLV